MARQQRSVRIDPELLAELERLVRARAVPETFAEQVDEGLRLLIAHAHDAQLRQAAERLAADQDRAEHHYRQLHGQRP